MPDPSVTRILQFPGYGVYQHEFDEAARTVTCWVRPEAAMPCTNGGRNTNGGRTFFAVSNREWRCPILCRRVSPGIAGLYVSRGLRQIRQMTG
jgi:hypothetical protein